MNEAKAKVWRDEQRKPGNIFAEANVARRNVKELLLLECPSFVKVPSLWVEGCYDFNCDEAVEVAAFGNCVEEKADERKLREVRDAVDADPKHPLWRSLRTIKWKAIGKTPEEISKLDDLYRLDACGNVLYRSALSHAPLGWQPDHLWPHALGGPTEPYNLHLLHSPVNLKVKNGRPWSQVRELGGIGIQEQMFLYIFAFPEQAWCGLTVHHLHEPLAFAVGDVELVTALALQVKPEDKNVDTIENPIIFAYVASFSYLKLEKLKKLHEALVDFSTSEDTNRLKTFQDSVEWRVLRNLLQLKCDFLVKRLEPIVESELQQVFAEHGVQDEDELRGKLNLEVNQKGQIEASEGYQFVVLQTERRLKGEIAKRTLDNILAKQFTFDNKKVSASEIKKMHLGSAKRIKALEDAIAKIDRFKSILKSAETFDLKK